jgi:ABC-type uncharacterized transport system fused permease/ATPase subunit
MSERAATGSAWESRPSVRRFWSTARGFWASPRAWILMVLLLVCVVLGLLVQYRLNYWNRDFFDALAERQSSRLFRQCELLPGLVAASVVLQVAAVWGRMTFQRLWRDWLTKALIGTWLEGRRYQRMSFVRGQRQNAEYRIAEDARLATDAPIDLLFGFLSSLLSGATFVVVLWNVGASVDIPIGGANVGIPRYLVIAAALYAAATSLSMMFVARHMVEVIDDKNQAEADFKYVMARVNSRATFEPHADDASTLDRAQQAVMREWCRMRGQFSRTTLVSSANYLFVPVVGLVLCAPNYLRGTLSLGEVTQAAAAFVAVQSSCNWFIDNFPRMAEWLSSASRVGVLLQTMDGIDADSGEVRVDEALPVDLIDRGQGIALGDG